MSRKSIAAYAALVVSVIACMSAVACADSTPLPNGKLLAVPATGSTGAGSFPVNIIPVLDGKYAVISNVGSRSSLVCISIASGQITGSISFPKGKGDDDSNGLYYGLAANGSFVYASEGVAGTVAIVQVGTNGSLHQIGTVGDEPHAFFSGVAVDSNGYLDVVQNGYDDTQTAADASNLIMPGIVRTVSLGTNLAVGHCVLKSILVQTPKYKFSPNNHPMAIVAEENSTRVFVGSQQDSNVYVLDTSNPAAPIVVTTVSTGSHPDALLFSKDQKNLFVANADSDTVSVVDPHALKVRSTIDLLPAAAHGLHGASPTGLALSPDQHTLYVTLGDMNAVAVVRVPTDKVMGYIPTGSYPTGIVATSNRLVVICARGDRTRIPNNVKQGSGGAWGTYVLNILEGTVRSISVPSTGQLAADTRQVIAANQFAAISAYRNSALASIGITSGKITHVIYIVKENRTYDQVLGDLPQAHGDPSLTLFGRRVTPNQHALAERFAILDNFFDCGDVSGDGWVWSTQSYANEEVDKDVPYEYSGRSNRYDFEGQNSGYLTGGFPTTDPYGKKMSDFLQDGAPAIPDVAESPGGHLWDIAKAAHVSYRNYGFFLSTGFATALPDNYPASSGLRPAGHDLSGTSDIDFRRFDLDFPDSNAGADYFAQDHNSADLWPTTSYGHYQVSSRYAEWQREFDEMIAADPSGAKAPALMTVRFMMDHTSAASSGKHSPRSDVADNDYAVGELVEHVSQSPIWKHTAIFVIEDDAQDGQDHIDAHRSTCYVISPYIEPHAIDHSFYNTDSVLHSIELLLGLRPMSQFDAIAEPIGNFHPNLVNPAPYQSILPAEQIIADHNPSASKMGMNDPRRPLALASDRMDFIHPDSAPANRVNTIVWKTVKGIRSNPPEPRHTVFPISRGAEISADSGVPERDDR